jgi:hypothetical protein
MTTSNSNVLKKICWNSVSLKIPEPWEIDSLDSSHVLIGEEGIPKVEVKWSNSPNKFTLEKFLKKFVAVSEKQLNIKIHEQSLPKFFSHPEVNFEFFFFLWESKSSTGKGVLIFCNHCKKLTMIRFFSNADIKLNSLPVQTLYSFTDHPTSDNVDWQIFDLSFSIPREFKLMDYSFQPGGYTMRFNYKKNSAQVFSWGPALFLLSKQNLEAFAIQRLPELQGGISSGTCMRGEYVEWCFRGGLSNYLEKVSFLNYFSIVTVFRIIHDRANNRLLGFMIKSPGNYNYDLMKLFVTIDEK